MNKSEISMERRYAAELPDYASDPDRDANMQRHEFLC
jgi:hypothetical protein